jgi:RNA polymerase sigma-70 factor (sigma-E family)
VTRVVRDDEAFRELALGHASGLRRLAYAICGDWHRADDLVQCCLERAYLHWRRVVGADDPGAYLRTILVRLAASEQRRAWRRRELSADVVPDSSEPVPGSVEDRVDLARYLAELTAKQRAVVVLRFIEDRPVPEVAAILGVAPGTVKRQTHDALQRLRALLPDQGDAPHGQDVKEAGRA